MNQNITIRPETPQDYYAVELLARDAGLGYYGPDADEHLHVYKTRRHRAFVPELDFVAELDGKVAGSIMYTRSRIIAKRKTYNDTLCLQYLGVIPSVQCRGVGRALVEHTIPLAKEMGFRAILFHGNPDYYPRLGFRPTSDFGIDGGFCMPLYEGALDGITHGRHIEPRIRLPKWQLRRFSRSFPPVDLSWVKPIEYLLEQLEEPARKAIASLKLKRLYQMCRQSERSVAAMPGVDDAALDTIRRVMRECNYGWGRGGNE